MVDGVNKTRIAYLRPTANEHSRVLRENFKNLSSGKVPAVVQENAVVTQNTERVRNKKVTELLGNLNDAVSFSSMALKSLEQIAGEDSSSVEAPPVVQEFAKDIDKLREDVSGILGLLRSRAEHAEVLQENLTSSEARIEDVEAARKKAIEAREGIQNNNAAAIDAHRGLSYDRVQALLSDD